MRICVIGSVDGVRIAPRTEAKNTIYCQYDNICCAENISKIPNIICTTGTWKIIPVLNISNIMKLKYSSNDHIGSTISEP